MSKPPIMSEFGITSIEWDGRNALTVEIATAKTDRFVQMYAGKRLAGVSTYPGQNIVTGQVQPTHCPTPITIILVDPVDRNTNFGAKLPRRPWNRWIAYWSATSFPADSKWFTVSMSAAAGEAVDYTKVLARVAYIGDGAYRFELPAVNECGQSTTGITSWDDALPNGNEGGNEELAVEALVYPPDVAIDENDQRLACSILGDVVKVAFNYDWEEE